MNSGLQTGIIGQSSRAAFIRLDPVEHVLIARAYAEPIDASAPLDTMTTPYVAVATITIAGDTAYIQALHGEMTHMIHREVRARLADQGVTRMLWRRQAGKQYQEAPQ